MKRPQFLAMLLAAVLILVEACNLPAPGPAQNAETATALAGTQGVPVTGGTGTPTQAILSVTTSVYCRTGPGSAYGLVATLEPGSGFLVLGKNSAGNFWIIANPAGGTCWVSGRNATVIGDISRLPEYPAPPKPTNTPGATATSSAGSLPAPASLKATRVCAKGFNGKVPIWAENVVLTWQPSQGQSGYRVFMNTLPINPVPGDSTADSIQFAYNRNSSQKSDTFAVQAFNGSGSSALTTVDVPRCP